MRNAETSASDMQNALRRLFEPDPVFLCHRPLPRTARCASFYNSLLARFWNLLLEDTLRAYVASLMFGCEVVDSLDVIHLVLMAFAAA